MIGQWRWRPGSLWGPSPRGQHTHVAPRSLPGYLGDPRSIEVTEFIHHFVFARPRDFVTPPPL